MRTTASSRMTAKAGHKVNSPVFFHIPLRQYRTAYERHEAGSDEVTHFFAEKSQSGNIIRYVTRIADKAP